MAEKEEGMLYSLTENKIRQLREREEVIRGSNQAIREMHERDIVELQGQYNYINEGV